MFSGLKDEPTGVTAAALIPVVNPPERPDLEEREDDDVREEVEEESEESEDEEDVTEGDVVEPEEPPLPTAVAKTPRKQGKLQMTDSIMYVKNVQQTWLAGFADQKT